ncbi:methyltransferase domain-containing protein [Gracilimonas halophila]|uniref:Methyltransferase domain-containing protein n=1 Tax=Gracilimonas halophila TaxID=1834464 RepID=A0ABW5JH16_9BACT
MSSFLSKRTPSLVEHMDRDDCNPVLLKNTYKQFPVINRLLSQWHRVYKNEILPFVKQHRTYSLLDIGFGGGDIPIKLAQWAKRDGIQLNITAIDTDRRAYEFATSKYPEGLVTWKHVSTKVLSQKKQKFDFVISNHLLHHLQDGEILTLLKEAKSLSTGKIIFSDIERSKTGYALFNVFSRVFFRHSFITKDGLISIRRSFTREELTNIVPADWKVKRMFPFRLLLIHEKS